MNQKQPMLTFTDHSWSLKKLQEYVGGYISQPIKLEDGRTMIVNEEGLLIGLPYNKDATELAQGKMGGVSISPDDYIVGNAVVFEKGAFK